MRVGRNKSERVNISFAKTAIDAHQSTFITTNVRTGVSRVPRMSVYVLFCITLYVRFATNVSDLPIVEDSHAYVYAQTYVRVVWAST